VHHWWWLSLLLLLLLLLLLVLNDSIYPQFYNLEVRSVDSVQHHLCSMH
jgi:hypothetical protein